MKPRLLAILCLLLLLSACHRPEQPSTASVPSDTAQTSSQPTQATTEPRETSLFSGSVTTGGLHVHTDVSAYRPRSSQAVYTRLSDGPLEEFVPSDDYGAVYPYTTAQLYSSTLEGYSWSSGSYQGFVDRSGRILTDGIYTGIEPAIRYVYEAFEEDTDYLPFWIVSRVDSANVYTQHSADGESWKDGAASYGVVSKDGRFALPCEYLSILTTEVGLICIRNWMRPDFSVYDLEGKLRFTGKDLFQETEDCGWGIEYGEGLYLFSVYTADGERTCWYFDEDGQKVLGPYREAAVFHEGLACVSLDSQSYGYIRKDGSWAISPNYTSVCDFHDGLTVQRLLDNTSVILDSEGEPVFQSTPGKWCYLVSCGFCVQNNYDDFTSYYDRNGTLLYEGEALRILDAQTFYEAKDGGLRIFRADGTELFIPAYEEVYLSPETILLDGRLQKGYRGVIYHENLAVFVPEDLSTYAVQSVGENAPDYFDRQDECAEPVWHVVRNGSDCIAQNDQGEQFRYRDDGQSSVRFMQDRIMIRTDAVCQYYDRAGKLIFSYPLHADD